MTEDYIRIIEEQDTVERELNIFQNHYLKVKSDYYDSFKKIPQEAFDLIKELHANSNRPEDAVTEFFVNNPEEFKDITEKLKKYPEYEVMNRLQIELDKLEYQNAIIMLSYSRKIEDDRTKLFTNEQFDKLDSLAERGWFLYYLRTPDLELDIPIEDFEEFLVSNYSRDNFRLLKFFTEKICDPGLDRNKIRLDKISDLKEVISSLEYGNLKSAARTMFSLLEHEHRSCSSLKGRSTGIQRSKEISRKVDLIDLAFLRRTWIAIDEYFRRVYSSKHDLSDVNRHELAHGIYNRDVTVADVFKLILLYVSFKELSFYLRLLHDTSELIVRDMKMKIAKDKLDNYENVSPSKKDIE